MKITFRFIVALLMLSAVSHAQTTPIQWSKMPEALKQNETSKKLMFVDVYTTWCGWCTRMDQTTFNDSTVASMLNEKFIPVKFNAEGSDSIYYNSNLYLNPRPGVSRSTHAFTFILLGQRFGYPSFAILDENNTVIGVLRGYQTPEQLLPALTYFSEGAYLKETYEEWTAKQ